MARYTEEEINILIATRRGEKARVLANLLWEAGVESDAVLYLQDATWELAVRYAREVGLLSEHAEMPSVFTKHLVFQLIQAKESAEVGIVKDAERID